MEEVKQCFTCGEVKPLQEYQKHKNDDGLTYRYERECKACSAIRKRLWMANKMQDPEYAQKRKERMKIAVTKYHKENKELVNEYARNYYHKNKKPPSKRIYVKTCPITGELFIARSNRGIYSKEGLLIYNRNRMRDGGYVDYYYRDGHNIRTCTICNKEYDYLKQGTVSFCSDECKKIANKAWKSARKHMDKARKKQSAYQFINPIKVFKRDKWRCQLCGTKTPQKLRGTILDNAPELDHIVPLARGGAHVYTNVQCLCRKCNGEKSDKLIGQLKLCC